MVCPWDWAKDTEERVSEMLKKRKALKNIGKGLKCLGF